MIDSGDEERDRGHPECQKRQVGFERIPVDDEGGDGAEQERREQGAL